MIQKLTWDQIVSTYPNEWVALIDAEESATQVIRGIVVTHAADRQQFHEMVREQMKKYHDLSIAYTGKLVEDPTIPLLWQISNTPQSTG